MAQEARYRTIASKNLELSLCQCQLGHGAFIFVDGIIRRNPVARSLARIF